MFIFDSLLIITLFIILIVGLVLTLSGLFGNTVIFIAVIVYALLSGFQTISLINLVIIGGLYLLGELLEYLFTLIGVRRLGASKAASWMALLGAFLGAFWGGTLFLGFGIIIGGFIGAVTAAIITELVIKNDLGLALRAGWGALIGKVSAMVVKAVIAVIIIVYVAQLVFV